MLYAENQESPGRVVVTSIALEESNKRRRGLLFMALKNPGKRSENKGEGRMVGRKRTGKYRGRPVSRIKFGRTRPIMPSVGTE